MYKEFGPMEGEIELCRLRVLLQKIQIAINDRGSSDQSESQLRKKGSPLNA
jgi:hypothetical protein